MINVREGTPGGGKTLSAVGEDILPALDQGRTVVTNIWLDDVAIAKLLRKDVSDQIVFLDPDEREEANEPVPFSVETDFSAYEGRLDPEKRGPLYVVDECHLALDQKSVLWKGRTDRRTNEEVQGEGVKITNWMAVHRHKACEVTLITQDRMSVPPEIRRRCEFFFRYKKLAMLGLSGRYVKTTYHRDDDRAIAKTLGKYPKEWFGLYKSTLDRVREKLPPVRNVLLSPRLVLIWAVVIGLFIWVLSSGIHIPGAHGTPPAGQTGAPSKLGAASPAGGAKQETADEKRLTEEVAVEKQKAYVQLIKDGRIPLDGGGGLTSPGKGGGFEYVELPKRKARFTLDGYSAQIDGYSLINGQATYYLTLVADDDVRHMRGGDMVQYGFELTPIAACLAFIRSPDWGTYRLTCDAPVKIGGPDYTERGAAVAEGRVRPWE